MYNWPVSLQEESNSLEISPGGLTKWETRVLEEPVRT